MSMKRLHRCVRWALAAICLGASIESAPANPSLRVCAVRDRQVLMLIEEREGANGLTAQKLSDAMFTMIHARKVCYEGRVLDALALYDGLAASLSSAALGRLDQGDDELATFSIPGKNVR